MNNNQNYNDCTSGCLFLLITIAILILTVWRISIKDIENKIDKLIELNTPEYINVVPEKVILENK